MRRDRSIKPCSGEIKIKQVRKVPNLRRDRSSKVCIGEIKVSKLIERTNEIWDGNFLEIVVGISCKRRKIIASRKVIFMLAIVAWRFTMLKLLREQPYCKAEGNKNFPPFYFF